MISALLVATHIINFQGNLRKFVKDLSGPTHPITQYSGLLDCFPLGCHDLLLWLHCCASSFCNHLCHLRHWSVDTNSDLKHSQTPGSSSTCWDAPLSYVFAAVGAFGLGLALVVVDLALWGGMVVWEQGESYIKIHSKAIYKKTWSKNVLATWLWTPSRRNQHWVYEMQV